MSTLRSDFLQYVAQTSPEPIDLTVEKAEGIYLHTPDGRKIIDFISGICVSNVGHGAPEIVEALQAQAAAYLHTMVYGEAVLSPQVRFAQRLAELLGERFGKVFFSNSGADAVEGALKVAKKFTGRSRIVSCWQAYHGSTHGALSVTGNDELKRGYGPLLPEIDFIHFNQFDELSQITEQTAAIIIEPIQGAAGAVVPAEGYLEAVRKRCDEVGALMILDEIQTGFGRTGSLFAFQDYDFEPDILVLAKALGGGMPMGAILTRTEIISVIQKDPILGLISTFGGHPMCCAAGLAALNKLIDDQLMARVPRLEALLHQHLRHPAIVELRGKGLLYAMIFQDYATAERVRGAALERGLLTIGFLSIDNGLRVSPPLTMTDAEMVAACEVVVAACE